MLPRSCLPRDTCWSTFSALLRSIEGEELAEYSKRAYSVYRTHGVIQDEAELDDYPVSEAKASDLPMLATQLRCLPATSQPASSANILHGASSRDTIPAGDIDQHGGGRKECVAVGVGVRDGVMPFSPPPSSPEQLLWPDVGEDRPFNRNGKVSADPPAETSASVDHELRVIDFSEAEDVVSSKPDKSATSPSEKFRSRLRAPRAGRALALASANAHGKRTSRREETSPGLRRDVSGKEELSPPPPSSENSTVPPRRKEAWIKEGGEAGHEVTVRTGGHEHELAYSVGLVGTTLEVSDEDEDGIVAQSSAFPRKAVEHSDGRRGMRRFTRREGRKSALNMERQERGAADGTGTGSGGNSEHSFDDEHNIKTEVSKGWPVDRLTAIEGCGSTSSPAPRISPQLKATTPRMTKDCLRRRGNTQSHVPNLETVSTGNSSLTTVLVAPPPPKPWVEGLHRSRNGDIGDEISTDREGLCEPRKAPDNEEFVWFGQPDTPSGCQPEEDFKNARKVRVEKGAPTTPALVAPEEVARKMAEQQFGPLRSSPHQQQRSKAQLLLQMEVRRQRAIIEQAFRAREEERRVRRARIGAEVFKRIKYLRGRRPPSPSTVPTVPPTSGLKQPPLSAKQDISTNDDREREPQAAMHRVQDAGTASPSHAENAVKAWGFRPARSENNAQAVQPARLAPDATPSEGIVTVGKVPPVETLAPVPPPESAHRVAAATDNPWRRVVSSQKQQELESGAPAKLEPTPPPVRFDVEANAFQDGAERPDGGINHEQEKARRQERYETLRARKMAEAEVSFSVVAH